MINTRGSATVSSFPRKPNIPKLRQFHQATIDLTDLTNSFTYLLMSTTITTGSGADHITGSAMMDFINSGAGNDTVHGGGAIDTINGGPDNDILHGDEEVGDYLFGGSGDDELWSGTGAPDGGAAYLEGGPDTDILDGEPEVDTPNEEVPETPEEVPETPIEEEPETPIEPLPEVNSAPVANDDSYSLMEDQDFTADNPGNVLDNDSDSDGDEMTVSLVSGPTDAANFVLNDDGTFEYRPVTDWDGTDTFVYQVSDDIDSTQATVTISAMSGNLIQVSAFNPAATPGIPLGQPVGDFAEGSLYDVVTVYDDQDQGYFPGGTATSEHFQDAADFGTAIAAHDWANLVAGLAQYVVAHGQINRLVIFDHGNNSNGQTIGNEFITPAMWADIKPLLSPGGTIRMGGCKVGSNATYCNAVATATGAIVEATAGNVHYQTRWFADDYWAADGTWLTF